MVWLKHRHADQVEAWVKMLAGLRNEFRDHAALMALATSAEEKYVFPRQEGRIAMRTLKRETGKAGSDAVGANGLAASYHSSWCPWQSRAHRARNEATPGGCQTQSHLTGKRRLQTAQCQDALDMFAQEIVFQIHLLSRPRISQGGHRMGVRRDP